MPQSSLPAGVGIEQLALQLHDAAVDVVQRLVETGEFALDLGERARLRRLLGRLGRSAGPRDGRDAPFEVRHEGVEHAGLAGLRLALRLGAPGPQRRALAREGRAQEPEFTLLVAQLLQRGFRLRGRCDRDGDGRPIDLGEAHWGELHRHAPSLAPATARVNLAPPAP
jgi:hypothetical protein